jgi:hypothetical protein
MCKPPSHVGRAVAALLVCCVLHAKAGYGQSTGVVVGQVVDETNVALPGVTVEWQSPDTLVPPPMTTTGPDGTYRLENVPVGSAEIAFRLMEFNVVRRPVAVIPGKPSTVNAVLKMALSAEVAVTVSRTFRNISGLETPGDGLIGIAAAASQGAVTAEQLEARPVMRAGEVLETVPGLMVSQHSGEGKANQYYLRGFNLDHGTDFAVTIAGVPLNLPSNAHFHGYSDANILIPELVNRVEFKKGPYFADQGDFSVAGAASVDYVSRLDRPIVVLSAGSDMWGRLLTAAAPKVGSGYLLGAVELTHNDGPWVNPDDFRKINGLLRYSQGDARSGFAVTGTGYWADWNATDQVPSRAISQGLISRFGYIDPTDAGRTHRYSLAADARRSGAKTFTHASAFALWYDLSLFSNFTYFLDDSINGDQFEQADRRVAAGGRLIHQRLGRLARWSAEHAVGAEVRHDSVGLVGLYKTVARRRTAMIREDEVSQTSTAAFAQSEIEWSRVLRTTFGVRGDLYHFNVLASDPRNSGTDTAGVLSPKVSAVFGPWHETEIYLNTGLGFHSNDARGATITVDPVTGRPTDRVTPLPRARGAEFGVRTIPRPGVQITASVWTLGLESEQLYIGDIGTTEASRPTRRFGVEWTNSVRVARWITLDADISLSRARFTDDDPVGDRVPGAVDRVISAGVGIEPEQRMFGSVRLRHFGPRALVEDDSVRSNATTLLNGELGYRFSDRTHLVLEVFNLLDRQVSDIDYFYTSRLSGEPPGGVDDVHTHPSVPRTARLTLRVGF